ncbi:MAG: thioredoxin domain-containing protein, partial [Phycisphaerales bacterium]
MARSDAPDVPNAPSRPANRLAAESSPYLLQHAHNPVDWYPWGPEAFEEARRRQVPIFLSVGYSTCYWCHVMERESFEDANTARLLNRDFVCVKVDREQRPDVDDIAMHACQALTGRGGWPTSVFLTPPSDDGSTPSLAPFWAGTYFPPEPRHGLPSFTQVLGGIAKAWADNRDQIAAQASRVADMLADTLGQRTLPVRIGPAQLDGALHALIRMYDPTNGGFGSPGAAGGPKFPQPVFLEFLLDRLQDTLDQQTRQAVLAAVTKTLDRMALGGINDQIGGGFHRYAVEPTWTVPHFEKMLYDNAQLASTYARASAMLEQDPHAPESFYARTARETLDYVLREMRVSGAAFASAQDAEVDGKEGDNYLWTPDQFASVLDTQDLQFALKVFALDRGPNFKDPHHADLPPRNVLALDDRPEHLASRFNLSTADFLQRLDQVRCKLYSARGVRTQPHLDDKVIASWNGLMLAGLAEGAALLKDAKYLDAAESAARFILTSMRDADGDLLRIWRGGSAQTPAFLEDYAMLAFGLTRLAHACEALGRPSTPHLDAASDLVDRAFALFADESAPGALFDTRSGQDDL